MQLESSITKPLHFISLKKLNYVVLSTQAWQWLVLYPLLSDYNLGNKLIWIVMLGEMDKNVIV